MVNFSDFIDLLDESPFMETPVDLETFMHSPKYLGFNIDFSDYQMEMIQAMSQILSLKTLEQLYGPEKALELNAKNYSEAIFCLGKGCHAPYTPIFNPTNGRWEKLAEIREGSVISFDGQPHYSTESFLEGFGEMVRVRTALGFEEDVYVGHKYLSYKRAKFYHRYRNIRPEMTSVRELAVGDRIGIMTNFDVEVPNSIPHVHGELIGYWLGDGSMPSERVNRLNVDFNSDEKESIARYLELSALIGDSPRVVVHETKKMVSVIHNSKSNAVALATYYGLFGKRAADKCIPERVLASDNSVVAATISKLWQTDGSVYLKSGYYMAEFVSVSELLALDVHKALLRLGIPSTIRSRVPKSNFKNAKRAWYVTVGSQECTERFFKSISLLDHKNVSIINRPGRVYKRFDGDIYYDRIVSITPLGDGEYWTRTVPDTGNYVGNGMISANSGKDFCSTIGCAYVVYQLLCMKDPAAYFGQAPGTSVDIVNIAINAKQANRVFFKEFKRRIESCRWFDGRCTPKQDMIEFDNNVTVYSGHSEREGWEGYNILLAILDEIAGFAIENTTGSAQAKTAEDIYRMYRDSVDSRFGDHGKVVLLSFPRYKDDFIMQKYNSVIMEKTTILKQEEVLINPELGYLPENILTFEWEEDWINYYKKARTFALRRPSWIVNPTKTIRDYVSSLYDDFPNAMGKFACMPPDAVDAFFRSRSKIELAFSYPIIDEVKPIKGKKYYIHVDLAQKIDRAAVAMAHVDKFKDIGQAIFGRSEIQPEVHVDILKYWTPSATENIHLKNIRDYIIDLYTRGFDIGLVTFDRWNSTEMIDELRAKGINAELLSVSKNHYLDMARAIMEERIVGPDDELLRKELLQLRVIRDKVDHPRSGGKDLADAVCGAIYNAIKHTPNLLVGEMEVHTISDLQREDPVVAAPKEKPHSTKPMPPDLAALVDSMLILE